MAAAAPRIHEVPDDLLAAIDWCYDQGWTDGLPVVPPAVDRVKAMLSADSRPAAIMRMRRALEEYIVEGIKTNIPFHKKLLVYEPFVQGRYDTRLVEKLLAENPA